MEIKFNSTPPKNVLFFNNSVDETSFASFQKSLIEMTNEIKEYENDLKEKCSIIGIPYKDKDHIINLYLSTYGGDVNYGLAFYDLLKNNSIPVHAICNGPVMSAGILMLCGCSERNAYKNVMFLIHSLATTCMSGKLDAIKERHEYLDKLQEKIIDVIVSNTFISKEKLIENVKYKEDWFFNTQEALKYNLIDNIL